MVIKNYIARAQNLILKKCSYISHIPVGEKIVYLTFDDGPEEGITEFIINELGKYNFKATFFCRGDNAEKNPELLTSLKNERHGLGNHTYSHIHAYKEPATSYYSDVERADEVLHTKLFRPPHGSLTIRLWSLLRRKYNIIYWSLNSGDSDMEAFNYQRSMSNLKSNTKNGDIVLFHFCHRHEKETMRLLPEYLLWLHENGYKCEVVDLGDND